jgi:glycosyltransferase involved in cell wall biosynthesis
VQDFLGTKAAMSMRIATCVPDLERLRSAMREEEIDAAYILLRYIVGGLEAHGHELTFVSQRNLHEPICTSDLEHLLPARLTWSGGRWFEFARKACWRIQQLLGIPYLNVFSSLRQYDACLHCLPGHDVVYERNGLYRDGVARACKRLGMPYVLFVDADEILEHDYMGESITGLLRWRASKMFQYNLDAADCVICVSEPAKQNLVNAWGVSAEKVAVLANGVDVERFRPYPESRYQVREQLGVGERPLLLFVGSFYSWHDVATLLVAFSQVLATNPEARLVLAGDGAQRQTMVQRAGDLGIAHAVHFVGFVPHAKVPHLISAADVAVAPYPATDRELWLSPMKLYEYLACGTPIVASATGQIAQVIRDGKNGLLVPPGDAAALAVALNRLLDNPGLCVQMGHQARNDAVQEHSWDRYLGRLERIFAAVRTRQPLDLGQIE